MSRLATFSSLWLLLLAFGFLVTFPEVVQAQDEDDASTGMMEEDDDVADDPRFQRAQAYHLEAKFDEAFALYDLLLKERGEDAPVLITYGHMKWKIGAYDEAEKYLKRAAKISPRHIKAKQFLGQCYLHQGQRKLAREEFDKLVALDWVREDVRHSGYLNLGKLELLDENWLKARKHFRLLVKEGHKADRKSGERGLKRMKEMRDFKEWPRVDTPCVFVHFHPKYPGMKEPAAREAMAKSMSDCVQAACNRLKIKTPEPWHIYMFPEEALAQQITGRLEAHGWDYSWWINYSAADSGIDPRHTLCCQLVARWAGSRPLSRMLVEGLACYIAGVDTDYHSKAKAYQANKDLRSMRKCQMLLRALDEHETRRQYNQGKSFVKFLIDTYGWDKFEKSWKVFNITVNAPRFKIRETKGIEWQDAFDAIFEAGIGVKQSVAEAEWREFLRKSS